MSQSPSLQQYLKIEPGLKQTQCMMMSQKMQLALKLLQLPTLELSSLIEEELRENPIIEITDYEKDSLDEEPNKVEDTLEESLKFDEHDFAILEKLDDDFKEHFKDAPYEPKEKQDDSLKNYKEQSIISENSLFEKLIQQAKEVFEKEKDLKMAESIIGNFDEKGFLSVSLQEIAALGDFSIEKLQSILKEIQTFTPAGIGAKSIQESLLIQLRHQNKQDTLSFKIIKDCYEDLLHNRIPLIAKKLQVSSDEINLNIKNTIAKLDLHPGMSDCKHIVQYIVPDVSIKLEGESWQVIVDEDHLPPIRIQPKYLKMVKDVNLGKETKEFIEDKLASIKWLFNCLHKRSETLKKIAYFLINHQSDYLTSESGSLLPMTLKKVADEMGVHESTIARAVANKYIDTPRGLLLLKSFFTSSIINASGKKISSKTIQDTLKDLIQNEDKKKPLSDEQLVSLLSEKGFSCARRTVAKYRQELGLGNTRQRRKF